MFASHPELAVVHESRFISAALANASRYGSGAAFDAGEFCRDLLDDPAVPSRLNSWPVSIEALRGAVLEARPAGVADAVRALYRTYAEAHGKPRYADKTPRYVNDLAGIGSAFPEARFVHLIRDGRDVALAWRDVPFGATGTFEAAHLWRSKVERARADGATLGAGRYLEVRYEELVSDPEPFARQICEFVELDFHPALLDHSARPEDVFDELDEQGHHSSLTLPITANLREWRTQMTPNEIRRFEAVAGNLLRDLGYALNGAGRAAPLYRAISHVAYVVGRARTKLARRAPAPL